MEVCKDLMNLIKLKLCRLNLWDKDSIESLSPCLFDQYHRDLLS